MAHAKARPSVEEVDLPSSSTSTSAAGLAACSTSAASCTGAIGLCGVSLEKEQHTTDELTDVSASMSQHLQTQTTRRRATGHEMYAGSWWTDTAYVSRR